MNSEKEGMMKIHEYSVLIYFVSVMILILVVPHIYASTSNSKISPVEEMWQSHCDFKGLFDNEDRWIEEFKMLEEPKDHANFQEMRDKISIFLTIPNDFIEKCPKLKKYLSELVKYHANNEHIPIVIRANIEYIQKKLTNETKRK